MISDARRSSTGQQVEDIAIDWVIRRADGPLDAGDEAAMQAWLAADPRHAAAFHDAQGMWDGLDVLAGQPGSLLDDLPPPRKTRQPFADAARTYPLRRASNAALMAAAVALVTGVGALWYGNPLTMMQADHRTAIGETRVVTLEDGSHVRLGPDSAIATHFTPRERRVELLSGVAAFAAIPREQAGGRPFVVAAAAGEARALGTRFAVDRLPTSVSVTVAQHKVRVAAPDGQATIVAPGYQVRYDARGLLSQVAVDIEQATGWQRGRLIVDSAPLGDVAAQFNRYRRGRIVVAGSALARREVSGVFDTHDIEGAVSTIAGELRLHSVRVGPLLTVLY